MKDFETVQGLIDAGWTEITDDGFIGLVGPFFQKGSGADLTFGFPTQDKHRNRRGVLQGGALVTFADRALGMAARVAARSERSATVELNTHFVDAIQIGEFIETRPSVVRTGRLVFVTALLTVGPRAVATVNGIWKVLDASVRR